MEKNSIDYSPLLSHQGDEIAGKVKASSPLVSATRWTLKSLICLIFTAWAALIFLIPSEPGHALFSKLITFTQNTPFGVTGYLLFLFLGFLFFFLTVTEWSEFKANLFCILQEALL